MNSIARRAQNGKTWLSVLIFANCVMWLWPLGAEETSIPERITDAEFQPSLKLLTEASTTLLLSQREQVEEQKILQRQSLEPPKVCHAWGPYSEADEVWTLEQKVSAEGVETEVLESEVRGEPDYLVYIVPTAMPEGARRMLEELRSQAIESHLIKQGRFSDTLSVGVFSQQARAKKQQEKVSALGYQVVVEELHHPRRVYHLLANAPAGFVPEVAPSGACSELAPVHQFL